MTYEELTGKLIVPLDFNKENNNVVNLIETTVVSEAFRKLVFITCCNEPALQAYVKRTLTDDGEYIYSTATRIKIFPCDVIDYMKIDGNFRESILHSFAQEMSDNDFHPIKVEDCINFFVWLRANRLC